MIIRANRDFPNPNFRVPEMSGSKNYGQISGVIFEDLIFLKPELPDPKIRVYPNAQPDAEHIRPGVIDNVFFNAIQT